MECVDTDRVAELLDPSPVRLPRERQQGSTKDGRRQRPRAGHRLVQGTGGRAVEVTSGKTPIDVGGICAPTRDATYRLLAERLSIP
jgi:hypothetical protein